MAADSGDVTSLRVPELQRQLTELETELVARKEAESFAARREEAFAEILSAINDPAADVERVFSVMIERATKLCSAAYGYIWLYDGQRARPAASFAEERFGDWLRHRESVPSDLTPLGEALLHRRLVHVVDATAHDGYRRHDGFRELVDRGGVRTLLHVPLCKGDSLLGVITVYRQERQPFSEREIALMQAFAAQAVIAIENARVLSELRQRTAALEETIAQQAATTEVLEGINSSPGDLRPVFDTMLEKAMQLCEAAFGQLDTYDGKDFHTAAVRGVPAPFAEYRNRHPNSYGPGTGPARLLAGERILYHLDLKDEETYRSGEPNRRALVDLGGARSAIQVALRKDGTFLGFINLSRQEVRPFTDKQGALLQNFAAQAVIAMENARLLREQREALERQTATAEVLQVINASPGQLEPVFEVMLEKAMALCGAAFGFLTSYDGQRFSPVAMRGVPPSLREYFSRGMDQPSAGEAHYRILQGEDVIHNLDQKEEDAYRAGLPLRRAVVDLGGARSALVVALRKDAEVLGALTIYRKEVRPFSDKEIGLMRNFAAQAVIAIENARLMNETRDALERQTATSEVLKVINSSPGDLAPVFDTMLERAVRLSESAFGMMNVYEDNRFRRVALRGVPAALIEQEPSLPTPGPNNALTRLMNGEDVVHIEDLRQSSSYREGDLRSRGMVELAGARSLLAVALRKDGVLLGTLTAYRQEVRPFSQKQIELLQGFAAQAVIAMENARLLEEQREALEQQTATTEVLQVINSSPGDIIPVFEAILEKAHALCGVAYGSLQLYDGEKFRAVAVHGLPQALADELRAGYVPGPTHPVRPLLAGEDSLQIPDMAGLGGASSALRSSGLGTALFVALRKDGLLLGQIVATRDEVRPFTDKETSLLQNFAQQAVIAMENARLLTEQREALEQQTATADILRVISQSPTDVQPVLKAVVGAARRFCGADDAMVVLREETEQLLATHEGSLQSLVGSRFPLDRSSATGRATIDGQTFHVPDVDLLDPAEHALTIELTRRTGVRALLAAPMLREGHAIGCVLLRRPTPGAFTPRQIELLEVFAAQAVIAIENVRLFNELQSSNDGLKEALDKQTATSEILRVISGSPTAVEPVFRTILVNANTLCDASFSLLWLWEGETLRVVAHEHVDVSSKLAEFIAKARPRPNRHTPLGLSVLERSVVHVEDVLNDARFVPEEVPIYRLEGARSILAVPMVREGILVGVINIWRREPGAFTSGQKALVQTFADQAVIAIENVRLFTELRESLERQTATAEILKVIARSPADMKPAFDAIAESAKRLLGGLSTTVWRLEGDAYRLEAFTPTTEEADLALRKMSVLPKEQGDTLAPAATGKSITEIPDTESGPAFMREIARLRGFRACLAASLTVEGQSIGFVNVTRREPGLFRREDVELLKTFADQAVIAIENVRLFTELRESLEQQTATTEVLQTINASPGNLQPVFDAIVDKAMSLCDSSSGLFNTFDGERFHSVATRGIPEVYAEFRRANPPDYRPDTGPGRLIAGEDVVPIDDTKNSELYRRGDPTRRALVDLGGARTVLNVALRKDRQLLGMIAIYRQEVRPFNQKEIALVKAFAAQAVIAMENARLINELRETLEQQTATAEILRVISQSPTDVGPVLEAVGSAARRYCGASDAIVTLREGGNMRVATHEGPLPARVGEVGPLDHTRLSGRCILQSKTIHVPDVDQLDQTEFSTTHELARQQGFRSILAAPMLRDSVAIGSILLRKSDRGPFTPRQVQLLDTFAAQAVIAIENVRLFTELRQALEQQTATADILRVMSRSPTDVKPVLEAVVAAARQFCGAADATVILREGTELTQTNHDGNLNQLLGIRLPLDRSTASGRAVVDRRTFHVADVHALDPGEFGTTIDLSRRTNVRSVLAAPMLRDGEAIGCLLLRRATAGAFEARQIELLETFASQAVIAIENVRLFTELRESLERLKAAQANLIQAEKMASLGQLTAGIAHEIKNPLNFINNFAGLSNELLDEVKQAVAALLVEPDDEKRAEVQETMDLLTGNLTRIVEHGKRADGIVKSMLSHSRGGSGDWQESNINALVEEALNLAYHGARAQDKDFNITLVRDLAPAVGPIDVVPQDITRVFLNLFGNAFYATRKRGAGNADPGYRPTLDVSTRDLGEAVEIRVRDNGTGIRSDIRAKLFQPFFTTKPTGEGTGLGLSISYDIVTHQHGGTIEVESEPGSFTEFTIRVPRGRRGTQSRGAT